MQITPVVAETPLSPDMLKSIEDAQKLADERLSEARVWQKQKNDEEAAEYKKKAMRAAHLDDWMHAEQIMAALSKDIENDPENYIPRYQRAYFNLSMGKLGEGWDEIAWRLFVPGQPNYDFFPIEIWDGHDVRGKNLFIWLEQGIGDQILASSMFADAARQAKSVTVFCNRRLLPIFRRSFPGITFHKPTDKIDFSKFDLQLTYGDLGALYRRSFDAFPKHNGFLKADPEKTAMFRKKYQAIKPGMIIGLSWFSAAPKIGHGKTIDIQDLIGLPLENNYISLQYEVDVPDYIQPHLPVYAEKSFDQVIDLDSFFAQVAAMDGVISISNTALHVAGALGKQALGLLSRGGCRNWYWFNERTDCPWYPSVELVRQEFSGDWDIPLRKAKQWVRP